MSGFSVRIFDDKIDVSSHVKDDYDNNVFEDDEVLIVFEGLLLNKAQMLQQYGISGYGQLFRSLYSRKNINIINEFEGEFSGLIYDKREKKVYAYTNPTATQKIYYACGKSGVFIDTNLARLNVNLQQFESTSPNIDAMYQLLVVGSMLEDFTPIQNVYKLLDGCFLEAKKDGTVNIRAYYSSVTGEKFNGTFKDAIKQIDEIFSRAIKLEYEKDQELRSSHLTLLSGGLDSRIGLFSAIRQGIVPDKVLCFSQSGYYDEIISRKIAFDLGLPYEFIPLDGGDFLKFIDEVTAIGEGCTVFSGALHVYHAIQKINFQNFKIFHGGQIGDGVLGGFNSAPKPEEPGFFKIIEDATYLSKIQGQLLDIFKNYETQEAFLLRNIAFNKTVLGAKVLQQKAIQTSPFMSRDFMSFAMFLPEKWKFRHKFYISWIDKCFPEATKYTWERTLLKPDAHWKTFAGDKVVKRANNILFSKLLKVKRYASMYPYQMYFDEAPGLQTFYNDYFNENFYRVEAFPELAKDVYALFYSKKYSAKARAVHILAVFKLFF